VAAGGEAGHQAVAWPGPEARADVEAGRDAVEDDAAEEQRHALGGAVRLVEDLHHHLEHDAEDDDVAHRAEPGLLAQRDPEQEQQRPDEADPDAGADRGVVREALVEDVPRHVPQAAEEDERGAEAVEDQARVELGQAPEEVRLRAGEHGAMLAEVVPYE
jgi:hypothetical protein